MSTRSDDPNHADIPRTHTIKPMDEPPMTKGSTTAQLKGDINSGRTGDKNEVFDPGLSPLGTDEEAGGSPLKPEQVDLARRQESTDRWQNGNDKDSYAHQHSRKALYGYVGFIGLVLVLFVGAFSMF
ncbi:hypothetical protein [Microvirga arsenatis]|uniref:Uncharacterized protein n=1 Tax=Microvirga arsenatis TaxID=2692265 RepID=A0ABW9YW20_9HYPH|nr:hypothetical protein [Microvirga arsenatis]NBJ10507.1 hypothetical protein [Microvirga arsenatis]NBJ24594.1 hypothetical protein [Microvirga arsenatis]